MIHPLVIAFGLIGFGMLIAMISKIIEDSGRKLSKEAQKFIDNRKQEREKQ